MLVADFLEMNDIFKHGGKAQKFTNATQFNS